MSKVIDLRLDFPPSPQKIAETMKYFVLNKDGKGVANYRRIFGPQWAASLGTSFEELEQKSEALSGDQLSAYLQELARKIAVTPAQFEKQLDEAGIENEIQVYEGAQHAFFNDTRSSSFDPDAAADAWPRTLDWFRTHLET